MYNEPDILDEISKYVFTGRYARYLPELKRRETWDECIDRVHSMHKRKFSHLDDDILEDISWAFDLVKDGRVAPSMRSMQFGGIAIEAKNERMFNCAVRHVDSIRSFSELFFLLLCGCGTGIGLSDKYLSRLPDLVGPADKTGAVLTYTVEDTIEGWADSVEALLNCYFKNTAYSGRKIVFDYSKIREEGAPLKTGGGKAPGYKGLKRAHGLIKELLDFIIEVRSLRRMRTIDAYDILMHLADAVLSGGVRRSATCVIFDPKDDLMMNAKTGNWFEDNPQRARSNNSARLIRGKVTIEEFFEIVEKTREWGEPGFVFADNEDMLFNPCFEVGFVPVTEDGVCGVQFCNLVTVNGAKIETAEDFYNAVAAAAIIGTLQASYTDFPYLSNAAKQLTDQEALLGVSITAMMDNPKVLFDPEVQRRGARIVVEVNRQISAEIGINQASRTTLVKPEGSSTLVYKSMASGIHGWHARVMFRRIQANKRDNVYQFFKQYNPHLCEPSVWSANGTDDVITFPVRAPEGAMLKSDLTALEHLELIKSTQQNWVIPGTTEVNQKNVHHNVSCTVVVQPHEWVEVADYLFANREYFAAVSLLASSGDKDYQQAPNEAVVTEEDKEKFEYYMKNFIPIDYTLMVEDQDETSVQQVLACAGNSCEY